MMKARKNMSSYRTRRTEMGKMLINASMYLVTGGIIGGFIAGKLNLIIGAILLAAVFIVAISGFYTIPADPDKED